MINKHLQIAFLVLFSVFSLGAYAADSKPKAPSFKLPGVKSTVNLSSYRGKVVYVDFWASWCGPCRKSFPWMSELQERYGQALKIIAINLDEDRKDAVSFLKKNRPKFTIAFDPKGKVAESYRVKAMPSSYLVDQYGRIVSAHAGFRSDDKQKLEQEIDKLLAKSRVSSSR